MMVVAGFVVQSAGVVATGGALVVVGGAFAFGAKRTLAPPGWASPSELDAMKDPEARAAAERGVAFVVGSFLVVLGGLIVAMSLAQALG